MCEYKDNKYKVEIICKEHGVFKQSPNSHLSGKGCPECGNNHRVSNEEFIDRCNLLHNNTYDYSLTNYVNKHTLVKIICKKHGIFELTPQSHYFKKVGCKLCKGRIDSTDSFIKKSIKIHNDSYDYSLTDYVNNKKCVKIICKKHGIFEQTPNSHLSGYGCIICGGKFKKSKEKFVEKSNIIHLDKYDYNLTNYVNNRTLVKIVCKKHGIFEQTPDSHLRGSGCPSCNESKGEKKIYNYLIDNKIKFERQKKFDDCRFKYKLKFDFYLTDYNTCIEYDGKQHFSISEFFGGIDDFNKLNINDRIKDNFCIDNNINLIRIPYYDFENIEKILINKINIKA